MHILQNGFSLTPSNLFLSQSVHPKIWNTMFSYVSKAFPQFPILSSHVKTSPHLPLLDDVRALQESDVRKPSPERKAHGRLVTE